MTNVHNHSQSWARERQDLMAISRDEVQRPLPSCVTLVKLLNLSVSPFPNLRNGKYMKGLPDRIVVRIK